MTHQLGFRDRFNYLLLAWNSISGKNEYRSPNSDKLANRED
jgi:hypothetical protein